MSSCLLLPEPIKSENDKRLYRAIQLDNGLKVLLISDTEPLENSEESPLETAVVEDAASECDSACDEGVEDDADEEEERHSEEEEDDAGCQKRKEKMAAAAMSVNVGSFSDPSDVQGLSHFLEHMLFMGSEKYPEENKFDEFISKNGGSDNANTDYERTNYELEVNTQCFKEALDIFAQFFISPLMKKDSVDRELESVESEFRLAMPNDSCRKDLILRSLAKPGNPVKLFAWGNLESLKTIPENDGIDIHARVREYYEKHYTSHIMTLCLISRESLDTLQEWAVSIFSNVVKRDISAVTFEGHEEPFNTPEFFKLYKVCPVKKVQQLTITWSLPSLIKHYKIKPLGYLGWLVGHEGPGSILEYLRKKVWAVGLEGGNDESNGDHNNLTSLFNVTVTMTDEGFEHLDEVFLTIFQYLDMLKKNGPQERIYDELKTLDEMNFRWKDEVDAVDYVSNLCVNMQIYEPEDYLRGDQLMLQYDADLIQECLHALRPDNCNIMILSTKYKKDDPCDKTEKWMQTSYSVEDIPDEWIQLWKSPPENPDLYLPEPNKFIATDFDIRMIEDNYNKEFPMKLKETNLTRLWYKKDSKFHVPKGYIYVHTKSPVCKCSPQNAVLLDMFIYQLQLNLSSETYAARMASLSFEGYRDGPGIVLKISGFNHKLHVLLSTILDYIVNFDLTQEMFDGLKVQFMKSYYNEFIKPRKLCQSLRLSALEHHYWTHVDKRLMVEKITMQSLKSFWTQLIGNLFTEIMIHGNFTPEEALNIAEMVENKLQFKPLLPEMIPVSRTMQLPVGEKVLRVMSFNNEDSNSSVTNYYQLGPGSVELMSKMDLLIQIMSEPCFNQLRSIEQLGYHVGCDSRNTHGIIGFLVVVNSPADKFSCTFLDERIESFLDDFKNKMDSMTEDEFQNHVSSLIKTKNCADLYMGRESDRNWGEITNSLYLFDRVKRETECLEKLKSEEFKEWTATVLDKTKFRKLSIQVVGYGEKALNECIPSKSKTGDVISIADLSLNTDKYELRYLRCTRKEKENFIDEIASFKSSLSIYPVWRIVK